MADRELNLAVAAETTLGASASDSTTTLTVTSSSGFPSVDFPVVLDADDDAKREVVIVTGVSGTTWTVTREQDGTSGVAHDSGAMVALVAVPSLWGDLHDRVEAHTHGGGTDGTAIDAGDLTGFDHGALSGLSDFTADHGTAHDAHDHSGAVGVATETAIKTADETVNNSATLQDDDHLSLSLDSNSTYVIEGSLDVDAGSVTGGLKGAFTIPSGASLSWAPRDSNPVTSSGTSADFGTSNGDRDRVTVHGYVEVSSTSGDLQFQWAQTTAEANDLVLKEGSWLRVEKIA